MYQEDRIWEVSKKMRKLVSRGYITEVVILALTYLFMCLREQMIST